MAMTPVEPFQPNPDAGDIGPGWFRRRLGRHLSEMLRLAPAIVLARSGIIVMVLVDTIIVGRYSTLELGFLAMGMSLVQPIIVTSLGLIMGTLVLTAHYLGAGREHECGAVWRRSVNFSLMLGVGGGVICLFGEELLTLTGQSEELARAGGGVMRVFGYGLPAHLLFLATSFFLEGIRRPAPGLVCMIIANIINLVLNLVLVAGTDTIPAMGAEGAAWATTAARWFLAIAMAGYVLGMKDQSRFGVRLAPEGGWRAWSYQRRLGYATGVSLAVEAFAFTAIQQFAGWLGPEPLAAFTVAFYMLVICFMVALGIGTATSVRVGIAHGRGDYRDIALAGWTGVGLTVISMAFLGLFLGFFGEWVAGVFSSDAKIITAAAALIFWVAVALIVDGGQACMANALRGRQDVWIPCGIQTISFLVIMIPVTYVLVFPMGHGAAGLFQGVLIAGIVAMSLLGARFHYLYCQDRL